MDGWMNERWYVVPALVVSNRGKAYELIFVEFLTIFLKAWMGLGEIWNKNLTTPPPQLKSSLWIYCMVTITTTFLLPY